MCYDSLIGINDNGLIIESLDRLDADIIYVIPSNQFPLSVSMKAEQKQALLNWAYKKENRYIIEDGYCSEFSNDRSETLYSLDSKGKVIYLGSFSKTIAPTFRCGFGDVFRILPYEGGLHLLLRAATRLHENEFKNAASEHGVGIYKLSSWERAASSLIPKNTFMIGFGDISKDDIIPGIAALNSAWETLLEQETN